MRFHDDHICNEFLYYAQPVKACTTFSCDCFKQKLQNDVPQAQTSRILMVFPTTQPKSLVTFAKYFNASMPSQIGWFCLAERAVKRFTWAPAYIYQ